MRLRPTNSTSDQETTILTWRKNFLRNTRTPRTTMTLLLNGLMPYADDKLSIGAKERPLLDADDCIRPLGVGRTYLSSLESSSQDMGVVTIRPHLALHTLCRHPSHPRSSSEYHAHNSSCHR